MYIYSTSIYLFVCVYLHTSGVLGMCLDTRTGAYIQYDIEFLFRCFEFDVTNIVVYGYTTI